MQPWRLQPTVYPKHKTEFREFWKKTVEACLVSGWKETPVRHNMCLDYAMSAHCRPQTFCFNSAFIHPNAIENILSDEQKFNNNGWDMFCQRDIRDFFPDYIEYFDEKLRVDKEFPFGPVPRIAVALSAHEVRLPVSLMIHEWRDGGEQKYDSSKSLGDLLNKIFPLSLEERPRIIPTPRSHFAFTEMLDWGNILERASISQYSPDNFDPNKTQDNGLVELSSVLYGTTYGQYVANVFPEINLLSHSPQTGDISSSTQGNASARDVYHFKFIRDAIDMTIKIITNIMNHARTTMFVRTQVPFTIVPPSIRNAIRRGDLRMIHNELCDSSEFAFIIRDPLMFRLRSVLQRLSLGWFPYHIVSEHDNRDKMITFFVSHAFGMKWNNISERIAATISKTFLSIEGKDLSFSQFNLDLLCSGFNLDSEGTDHVGEISSVKFQSSLEFLQTTIRDWRPPLEKDYDIVIPRVRIISTDCADAFAFDVKFD